VASRRKAEELIRSGRVSVNGRPVELGTRIHPGDAVRLDGRLLELGRTSVTFMLNKPAGILSSVTDDRGRKTVTDLLPAVPGLHPVGRLDLNSEGLLLLTTDGDLTLRLTHPRYGKEKEYRVWCRQGTVGTRALQRLREGVLLEDGPARADSVRSEPGGCSIVLSEGRKRQVRRMLAAVDYDVIRLQRTRLGSIRLGNLPEGQYRKLSDAELMALLEP
jgi:23S rRNA pseudouridine2605 synthase